MFGQARMGGWRKIGLDDDFPIRQAAASWGFGFGFGAGLAGLGFL